MHRIKPITVALNDVYLKQCQFAPLLQALFFREGEITHVPSSLFSRKLPIKVQFKKKNHNAT